MQVIVSHTNTDFDGLASIVAASKLYPRAKMVLPEKVSTSVKHFLAIYRDSFAFMAIKEIDWVKLQHLIMVDIADLARTGKLAHEVQPDNIKFTVYDHHPPSEQDVNSDSGNIELLGATVTLLIEEIRAKNIKISTFEATLFAIGLYTDTGAFTYLGTTARDLAAGAWLLEQGANLAIVAQYSERPLLDEQQQILNVLLQNAIEYQIQGVEVTVSWHSQKKYVGGLAVLSRKLMDITGSQAAVIIVEMAKKIFITGRSGTDRVDILPVMLEFGGGGHSKAASASVKNGKLEQIIKTVQDLVPRLVKPAITARMMMSSPVKTINQQTTIEDAAKMMLRYGHTGFPVLNEGKLVGIISRRDLDKAKHHGLGHAPVKGFMSKDVLTIHTDTTLEEIQEVMIEHNVGRLPVVADDDEHNLLGIVSRTNVVEYLHGKHREEADASHSLEKKQTEPRTIDIIEKMKQNIEPMILQLLSNIGSLADEQSSNAYIIGGVVRDLILARHNEDIDIVLEGDAIKFAQLLADKYGGKVRGHDKFGTASWKIDKLSSTNYEDGHQALKIDITTARREYYDFPAALPTVERSSLREDLYRRDFTLNAMAVQINSKKFGTLIDFFHGLEDIKYKKIKVLYNLSFVEDPTRILRAVRFELRFAFKMDRQTEELALASLDKIALVSEVRIANELYYLLTEEHPLEAMKRLHDLGVWEYLLPKSKTDLVDGSDLEYNWQKSSTYIKKIAKLTDKLRANNMLSEDSRIWFVYLLGMVVNYQDWRQALERFALNNQDLEIINQLQHLLEVYDKIDYSKELHNYCANIRTEAIVALLSWCDLSEAVQAQVLKYLEKRLTIPEWLTGKILKQLGIKPGPIYSQVLFDYQSAYLAGAVKKPKEALVWLNKYMKRTVEKTIEKNSK